jgi:protein-tyrosine phosphatase
MAEAIFKRLAEEQGVALSFQISSRATSDCEEGNAVYPPAQRVLKNYGYNFAHIARQINLQEVKNADYILVMDEINLKDLLRLTGGNYGDKIFKLGHFLKDKIDIDDPWYTGEFDRTYNEIYSSCQAFLNFLLIKHSSAFTYDKYN